MSRVYSTNKWRGRIDSADDPTLLRWHQRIHVVENDNLPDPIASKRNIALIGFACDEGVRRNQGRCGASDGPEAFREAFASLPANIDNCEIWDFGNITCDAAKLEEAQEEFASLVSRVISKGFVPFAIGGGHEIAWAHFKGLSDAAALENWGVFNVDAHWDLRESAEANSGTPFMQIANWYKEKQRLFSYFCLGINPAANTRKLHDTALELEAQCIENTKLLCASDKDRLKYSEQIRVFAKKKNSIYLTICLDAFSASLCPGVSAPSPMGLELANTLPLISDLIATGKVKSLDIAELNPSLDIDSRTARFSAQLFQLILVEFSKLDV